MVTLKSPPGWERYQVMKIMLTVSLLITAVCVLRSCPSKSQKMWTIGEHKIVIIERHQEGNIYTEIREPAAGEQRFAYINAKLYITLENEVLTVNGKKYVIPKKDDSIQITDGRVEINGQAAAPEE